MIGIRPDYKIAVNADVLQEIDGPMLKHGIQEMHGRTIELPTHRKDHPDRDALAWRWERFAS